MSTPLVILGCGYVGRRLAMAVRGQGRKIRVTTRKLSNLAPDFAPLGIEVVTCEASKAKQFGPAVQGLLGATVIYSIPPVNDLPAGEAVRRAANAALNIGARAFIYLGSAGLYGMTASDEWIDEESTVTHDDPAMASYHSEEAAVQGALAAGLRTVSFRLAPVYGPGRGVRVRMRKGDYRLVDEGNHWISRVHVDDLVRIILAAEERAPAGSQYMVGDDTPTLQREVAEWLSEQLGLPRPMSVPSVAPGQPRQALRLRRIRNDKLKRELGIKLLYPSFREGELQIDEEEGRVPVGTAQAAAAGAGATAAAASPAPAAVGVTAGGADAVAPAVAAVADALGLAGAAAAAATLGAAGAALAATGGTAAPAAAPSQPVALAQAAAPTGPASSRRFRLDDLPAEGAIRVERVPPRATVTLPANTRLVQVVAGNLSLLDGGRPLILGTGDVLDRPGAVQIRNDGTMEARLLVVDAEPA